MSRTLSIYSYNQGSQGAKVLAEALDCRVIKQANSTYKAKPSKIVINWGASVFPVHVQGSKVFNAPGVVGAMTNKLRFFNLMKDEVELPEFFTQPRDVALHFEQKIPQDSTVVCRQKLTGHSGEGIVLYTREQYRSGIDIPRASLYTKYVKKSAEYRVHCMKGLGIIDVQRKIKDPDREVTEWKIRNHNNGFIFARENLEVPGEVLEEALKCFDLTGLDFGALDIIWNNKEQKAYILEVNTAPGLTGTTLVNYVNAFKSIIKEA